MNRDNKQETCIPIEVAVPGDRNVLKKEAEILKYRVFKKLTRNLFLTFHGQNVHRQQRQPSTFLMCYQQFASHA
jgi:hypothetical protein